MARNQTATDLPLVPGALAGVGAWLVGYAFTYLLVGSDVRESNLNQFIEVFDGDPATYDLVGWVFYNAHLVDIVYEGFGGNFLPASYVGGEDGVTTLMYVIPPALLVASGLALARYRGATDVNDGALVGALVVPGYLVVAIAGAFLFEVSAAGTTGRPDLLLAVVLAGIVYPVVFGAAGGVIGALTADE